MKHWPSLFRSKPWQHGVTKTGHPSPVLDKPSGGGEEQSPGGQKPRWNPKPEQVRILESIFNSGMVHPSRDEIRRIRTRLLEHGDVGDASVFYWFQNRKSRSKHKLRASKHAVKAPAPSSFSGCSDKPPPVPVSVSASLTQTCLQGSSDVVFAEQLLLQAHQGLSCYPDPPPLGEIPFPATVTAAPLAETPQLHTSPFDETIQETSIVFINDVAVEVAAALPVNFKEIFGMEAVLVNSSGSPVPTDEAGLTMQPLRHGDSYYLIFPSLYYNGSIIL